MKRCDRIVEIQEDCRRLANVETGEKETPPGEKETPPGEKVTKVGEKANFVGEKKIIHRGAGPGLPAPAQGMGTLAETGSDTSQGT